MTRNSATTIAAATLAGLVSAAALIALAAWMFAQVQP